MEFLSGNVTAVLWHTGFFEMCCAGHCSTAATNGITPAGPVF